MLPADGVFSDKIIIAATPNYGCFYVNEKERESEGGGEQISKEVTESCCSRT